MSILYINEKFYKKLQEDNDTIKVIKLYGYADADSFMKGIIDYLNRKYDYLKITGFDFLLDEENSTYGMFNGYVKGDFADYDQVTVSFSTLYTKEGNTIISQQVMPMLQKKIEEDVSFLANPRNKKIFLLTSHKSTIFEASRNSIKEDSYGSTLQMLVRCLVTMGFDVFSFIPVINLDVTKPYDNITDFIDNIDYISKQNSSNVQHRQIVFDGKKVVGSFMEKPSGQEEKYFALKFMTAITLNNSYIYDVSQPVMVSQNTSQMKTLQDFAFFVSKNNISFKNDGTFTNEKLVELAEKEDKYLKRLKELAEKYGEKGTRIVDVEVRLSEVQAALRNRLIKEHGKKCMLCGITNEKMLIASHIKNASACDIYGKADVNNCFLLCANHDKLFDKYLISFSFIDGSIMISKNLTKEEIEICQLDPSYKLPEEMLTPERVEYLMWHNDEFEKNEV